MGTATKAVPSVFLMGGNNLSKRDNQNDKADGDSQIYRDGPLFFSYHAYEPSYEGNYPTNPGKKYRNSEGGITEERIATALS